MSASSSMTSGGPTGSGGGAFADHPRSFATNRYVYPVLSRRAGGLSIGVNLSRDNACDFRCVYCQVDRNVIPPPEPVDLPVLAAELEHAVGLVESGQIFAVRPFSQTPPAMRRLNDIALSGDGEPTANPQIEEVVAVCAAARSRHRLGDAKLVLITNATLLGQPNVVRALELLDTNNGEIWAKLDAGTEAFYRQVCRSAVPWQRILENLRSAAQRRAIVIQSLFMRIRGEGPAARELDAYCDRLREIAADRGRIKLVQVHTVARPPAEPWVEPLTNAEVDEIAALVRTRTGLHVAAYYGQSLS